MATIKDVAKLAGVSTTTVSHVINKTRFVAEKTTQAVWDAISELNYSPSAVARSLKVNTTKSIGMIVTTSESPFFAEIILAMERHCYEMGYSLFLCNTQNDPEKIQNHLDMLMTKRVDGILVMCSEYTENSLALLNRTNIPMVVMDWGQECDSDVIMDNSFIGGYLAAQHLIENGHKDIAVICGNLFKTVSKNRFQGFSKAMSEADLMIALGARFDDRVTGKLSEFAKHAKIIHVDIDPSSIGKLVEVDFPIVGDMKDVLEQMLPQAKEKIDAKQYKNWRDLLKRYAQIHPLGYEDSDEIIKPQWAIEEVGRILGDKAVVSTDVGQHQMWTAQFYPFTYPRQYITSGGLGTMGYGFPAAMGAKWGNKEKISINFTGDGSILMNIQELMSAVEFKIPVINIILNNNYLGMVRQWQSFFYENRFASTDLSHQPDFVKLAESFGGLGFRVKTKEEFRKALDMAVKNNTVTMIDVQVDRLENVLPMVPAGGTLYNMMLEYKD